MYQPPGCFPIPLSRIMLTQHLVQCYNNIILLVSLDAHYISVYGVLRALHVLGANSALGVRVPGATGVLGALGVLGVLAWCRLRCPWNLICFQCTIIIGSKCPSWYNKANMMAI